MVSAAAHVLAASTAPALDPERPPARVLLVSIRRLNSHAAWCSNYEFEDVIRAVDDVDVLELEPAPRFEVRHHITRTLAWRGPYAPFARLNPGLKRATVTGDYDLLVFVCMNAWDLLYLNALRGWRDRCRVKLCYITELYAGQAKRYRHFLELLADFDHVALSFSGSLPALDAVLGKTGHHLPVATDVLRFTPYPEPPPRVIDVLSVGRRAEPVHQALLQLAAARRIFYMHDTVPGPLIRPSSSAEHRAMLANSAKRSRYFIAYPAKFGDEENQGQSEVGARYFEGAATGAVLLGQAPTVPAFRADFPWSDAVVETSADGGNVVDVLASLQARPAEVARMGARNAAAALRLHDWAHRWRSVLRIAGLPPRPALTERVRALSRLADGAEASL